MGSNRSAAGPVIHPSGGVREQVQQLLDLVIHHVNEEENEVFPKMRDAFSKDELDDICTQAIETKKQLSKSVQR